MTVTNENRNVVYLGNGVTTEFPFEFPVFSEEDIEIKLVLDGELTSTEDFTVELNNGGVNGGTVTFTGDVLTSDDKIIIVRTLAATQDTSITNQTRFFPNVIEDTFDRIVMLLQQALDESSRALKVTPSVAERSGQEFVPELDGLLTFDSDGNAVIEYTVPQIENFVSDAQSAASAAQLAEENAVSARDRAQEWAENPEDEEVGAGEFSALHWAAKAAQSATLSTRVIYVETIADLQALDTSPLPDGQQVRVAENGSIYAWDASEEEWERLDPDDRVLQADDVEDVVRVTDQEWTPEQQEQARENISALSRSLDDLDATAEEKVIFRKEVGIRASRATIQHKSTDAFGGTIYYDVIRVFGGPHTVVKNYGPDADANGVMLRRTARDLAKTLGFTVVVNADHFRAPDGDEWHTSPDAICRGLQIVDGVAVREWPDDGSSINQALVMMRDGSVRQSVRDDDLSASKSAQDWVDEGALWSVVGRGFALIDGVDQSLASTDVAGRTILGRDANDDWVIILVEGVTGTSGIDTDDVGALASSEGCVTAFLCDGGGSSQCWWNNAYAMPASGVDPDPDPFDGGRKVAGWLCLDASVPDYDSGLIPLSTPSEVSANSGTGPLPAMSLRQVGPVVTLQANASIDPEISTTSTLQVATGARSRYRGHHQQAMNGFLVAGPAGDNARRPVSITVGGGGDFSFSARAGTSDNPGQFGVISLWGSYSWRHRWTG